MEDCPDGVVEGELLEDPPPALSLEPLPRSDSKFSAVEDGGVELGAGAGEELGVNPGNALAGGADGCTLGGTGEIGNESPAIAASAWPVTQTEVWSLEAE